MTESTYNGRVRLSGHPLLVEARGRALTALGYKFAGGLKVRSNGRTTETLIYVQQKQ